MKRMKLNVSYFRRIGMIGFTLLCHGVAGADSGCPDCPPGWSCYATPVPPSKPAPGTTPKPTPTPIKSPLGEALWGANRMVSAPSGTGRLYGNFSDPDFYIGDLDLSLPAKKGPDGQNPHTDEPTFFYAMQGSGVYIDAGMQWEQFPTIYGTETADPGWAIFILIRAPGTWPRKCYVFEEPPKRCAKSQLGLTSLELKIVDGLGNVQVTAQTANQGTFQTKKWYPYWERATDSKLRTNNPGFVMGINGWTMFRTIGITQAGGSTSHANPYGCFYDGSWMNKVAFSGGQASKVLQNLNGLYLAAWDPSGTYPWPYQRTISSQKGVYNPFWYRPNAHDHRNFDPHHPWPIDFEGQDKLDAHGNDQHVNDLQVLKRRMTTETVDIYLLPGPTHVYTQGAKTSLSRSAGSHH